MNKFKTIDNMNANFAVLSDQELIEMDGGALPVIAGVAAWKVGAAVIGGGAALFGGGALLGYYANRP